MPETQQQERGPRVSEANMAAVLAEMETITPDSKFDFTDMDNSGAGERPAKKAAAEPAAAAGEEGAEAPPTEETPAEETAVEEPEKAAEEEPAEEGAKEEAAPEAELKAKEEEDPAQARRIEAIQRQRKRALEEVEEKRLSALSELEKREARVRESEKGISLLDNLKERALTDPIGLLAELGHNAKTFEGVAKDAFHMSERGQQEPGAREAVQRSRRERALQQQLEQTTKRLDEFEQREQRRESDRVSQQRAAKYLDRIATSVPAECGLMANLLKNDREEALETFRAAALRIIEETGDSEPDPKEVVKYAEKIDRARLQRLGIDPDDVLGRQTKSKTPVAEKSKAAPKTLSNDLGPTTTPRSAPKSRDEQIAEVARMMEAGQLDE